MTRRQRSTAPCWRNTSACPPERRSRTSTRSDVAHGVFVRVSHQHLSVSRHRLPPLSQADNQVDNVRQHFYEVSLEYVFKVQEVQERKMFDFVEPVSPFIKPTCRSDPFIPSHRPLHVLSVFVFIHLVI